MILLFGHTGYIGSEFKKQLKDNVVIAPSHKECWSYNQLRDFIKTSKARYVINASGYTGKPNVDACELHKAECYNGNITYPINIASACYDLRVTFCHVSSGCIYNGYDKIFTEEDEPNFSFKQNNCSYYSGTKAKAEELLLNAFPSSYVWRLRIPFESQVNPRNYITKILNYNKILNLPNSLSHKEEFVKLCLETISKQIPFGIYNVTNQGSMTAKDVYKLLSMHHLEYVDIIKKKEFYDSLEEFNKDIVAPRSNCILNVNKLSSYDVIPRHIYDAMAATIRKYGM